MIYGFTPSDLTAIGLYFLVIILIGIYAAGKIKNQEDYFLGGRSFGKVIQIFAAFGQATSSDSAVSTTLLTARNGLAGVWTSLIGVFQIPTYWITSVWYRRLRILTLGDFFEERYNSKSMAGVYAVLSSVFFMLVIGLGFTAMAKTIAAVAIKPIEILSIEERAEYDRSIELMQLEQVDVRSLSAEELQRLSTLRLENPRREFTMVNEQFLMWLAAIVVIAYAAMGGLQAAFLTDTLQGFFIILLSCILVPFAMIEINQTFGGSGLQGIFDASRARIPESMFEVWGSPLNADFTWYYIVALTFMTVINVAVQGNQLVCMGAAKDEYTAQIGFCTGIYMKRICTLLWGITAILLIVLYSGEVQNAEYLWGHACRDLLGSLGIGLVGLMVACLMAGLMSTADALMITAAGLITHNIVRPLLPNLAEKTYVRIGRWAGAGVVIGAVLIVSHFDNFIDLIKFLWEFNAVIAASFWVGMKWRRANKQGAWASILASCLLFILMPVTLPLIPGVKNNTYLLKTTEPLAIERVYSARDVDVAQRDLEISRWHTAAVPGQEPPQALIPGESFIKTTLTPQRSVFWTQGVQAGADGHLAGRGMLSIELIVFDQLGWQLENNPHALNETIRLVVRIIFPFLVLFLVSMLTSADRSVRLQHFYARLRTPVLADHDADAAAVALSIKDPNRCKDQLLFPDSNWELFKWKALDWKAQFIIAAGGAAIFLVLWLLSLAGR